MRWLLLAFVGLRVFDFDTSVLQFFYKSVTGMILKGSKYGSRFEKNVRGVF